MVSLSHRQSDCLFIGLGIVMVIMAFLFMVPPRNYVSDAVRGLTSLIAILIGFTGFILQNVVSRADSELKKWMQKQVQITASIILLDVLFIVLSYRDLVDESLTRSFTWIIVALFIAFVLFVRTLLLTYIEEEDIS